MRTSCTRKLRLRGALLAGALASASLPGCFQRALDIRTTPQPASVSVNGELVGESPLLVPFDFYGTFHVVARAEGHLSERLVYEAEAPWFLTFPLDIFVEFLLPWAIDDVHEIHVELERLPETLDGRQVDEIRAKAKQERERSVSEPSGGNGEGPGEQ